MSNTDEISTDLSKDFDKKAVIVEGESVVVTETVTFDWLQENEIGPLPESEVRKPTPTTKLDSQEKKQRLPSSSSRASSRGSYHRNRKSHNNGRPNYNGEIVPKVKVGSNFSNDVRVTRDINIPRIIIDPKKDKIQTEKAKDELRSRVMASIKKGQQDAAKNEETKESKSFESVKGSAVSAPSKESVVRNKAIFGETVPVDTHTRFQEFMDKAKETKKVVQEAPKKPDASPPKHFKILKRPGKVGRTFTNKNAQRKNAEQNSDGQNTANSAESPSSPVQSVKENLEITKTTNVAANRNTNSNKNCHPKSSSNQFNKSMNSQSFHPRVVMPQNGQMPNPMMGNIQYVAMPWDGSTPYQPNPFMPFGSYFIPMMPPSQTQMYPPSPENPQGFVQMPMFHLPMPYPPPVRPPPQFIPKKNLNNPSN